MAYQCRGCSYRGERFPAGACPACGSADVRSIARAPLRQTEARKPFRISFASALWLLLLVLLYRQFFPG